VVEPVELEFARAATCGSERFVSDRPDDLRLAQLVVDVNTPQATRFSGRV
jgi:hypothetical protein